MDMFHVGVSTLFVTTASTETLNGTSLGVTIVASPPYLAK